MSCSVFPPFLLHGLAFCLLFHLQEFYRVNVDSYCCNRKATENSFYWSESSGRQKKALDTKMFVTGDWLVCEAWESLWWEIMPVNPPQLSWCHYCHGHCTHFQLKDHTASAMVQKTPRSRVASSFDGYRMRTWRDIELLTMLPNTFVTKNSHGLMCTTTSFQVSFNASIWWVLKKNLLHIAHDKQGLLSQNLLWDSEWSPGCSTHLIQVPANASGKSSSLLRCLGPCHSHGTYRRSSWLWRSPLVAIVAIQAVNQRMEKSLPLSLLISLSL